MISSSHSIIQKMEEGKLHVRVVQLTAIAKATNINPLKLYRATLAPKEPKG